MNKQLIIDNKECFDHWLAGGKLLCKLTTSTTAKYEQWLDPEDSDNELAIFNDVGYGAIYIINDEYSDYRKALAEGAELLQCYQGRGSTGEREPFNGTFNSNFTYTIKPDEPKFKVGDWVCYVDQELMSDYPRVLQVSEYLDEDNIILTGFDGHNQHDELELWVPQPGEYCKFYDVDEAMFTVAPYGFCDYNSEIQLEYFSSNFDYCEPYLEPLPAHLQE